MFLQTTQFVIIPSQSDLSSVYQVIIMTRLWATRV